MPEVILPVVFGGFFVLILVAAYFANEAAKRRRAALAALAAELGFEYLEGGITGTGPRKGFWESLGSGFELSPEGSFMQRFHGFSPFGQGHSRDVANLIVGRRGDRDWYLFDYTYKTTSSNGKTTTTTTHPYGVVAVRAPLAFPGLSMAEENFLHRIGTKLGVRELTFELEEFNRRYFVQCGDARAAHDLLHPKAIEYLMAHPTRWWQFGGPMVLVAKAGFYDPLEARRVMQEMEGFLDLVPEYVRQDRGFVAQWGGPLD